MGNPTLRLIVLLLIVLIFAGCDDKESSYELNFSRDKLGYQCEVFLELESSKECDCTWNCDCGNISNAIDNTATWCAPNEIGEFEVKCLVDGEEVASKTFDVCGVVYDDFSIEEHVWDEWATSHSSAELIDEKIYFNPTSSDYYGIVERELFNTLDPGYTVSADLGNNTTLSNYDIYGLNIGVNDTGDLTATSYWVALGDINSENDNWAFIVFLFSFNPFIAEWCLLDQNSSGYSSDIGLYGETNHIELTMTDNKYVKLDINGQELLYSNELNNLENEFSMTFSIGLEEVEGRSSGPVIFLDNVIVEETYSKRNHVNNPDTLSRNAADQAKSNINVDITNIRTLRETLEERF